MGAWLRALEEARHQAEGLGNHVRALELVVAAWADADVEARFHLHRFAQWLARRLEPWHEPAGLRARLAVPPELWCEPPVREAGPGAAVGRCGALLVDRDRSGEAFVAEVVIEAAPGSRDLFPPEAGVSFREAVAAAELAVLRFLRRRGRLQPRATLRAGTWLRLRGPAACARGHLEGGSIGAAAAVALYSSWTGTPAPGGLLVTGALDADGAVGAVASLEAKVRAALRERPGTCKVLVPEGQAASAGDARVIGVRDLGRLLEEAFGPDALRQGDAAALDIEGAVRKGVELYEKANDYVASAEVLRGVLEALPLRREREPGSFRREELVALWRLGSSLVHRGDVEAATEVLGRAEALGQELWRASVLGPEEWLGFHTTLAVLLRDVYRYDDAERLLRATLALQRELRQDKRLQARTLGNLGELWSFMGKHAEARQVLEEALEALRAAYPDEVPRGHCNLGNLALARGAPRRALAHYGRGLELNARVAYGRLPNEAFLRYGLARAHLALRQPDAVVAAAAPVLPELAPADPYPRQLLLACLALAHLEAGRRAEAERSLSAATDLEYVQGALLRFGVSTALAHWALFELSTPGGPHLPELGQLTASLRRVPGLDAGPRLAERIERLAATTPLPRDELREALEESVGAFPYGIPLRSGQPRST